MAGGGDGGGEVERGPEGHQDNAARSSTRWAALLSAVSPSNLVSVSSQITSPQIVRKQRSIVPRAAAPYHKWASIKLPVLPPAAPKRKRKKAAKKRDTPCALCGAAETPLWRTWPTDRRVALCNACGIQVRTSGVVLPELVYLPHPATAATTATATVVSELEPQPVPPPREIQAPVIISDSPRSVLPKQLRVNLPPPATATVVSELEPQPVPHPHEIQAPVIISDSPRRSVLPKQVRVNLPPPATATTTAVVPVVEQPRQQEIQESDSVSPPDSPILDSMLDADVYLLKRTSGRRQHSPPPPPPTAGEPEPAVAAPAPGNEEDKQQAPDRWCRHCGITWTLQWRTGPTGEGTLCNACGVSYRKGQLVPEYRPKASPSFNEAEHSNVHGVVLQMRQMLDDPEPPAPYLPVKPRLKRRKGNKGQQQQPAEARKKHKSNNSNKEQNQQPAAQAQSAAMAAVQQVHDDNDDDDDEERLPPEPALLKLRRKQLKSTEQRQHLPPPPPPPELPRAQAAADNDDIDLMTGCMQLLQPLPPAKPHAGDDLMMMGPPDPFLFDGPSAPRIIEEEKKPVVVIVIDDD